MLPKLSKSLEIRKISINATGLTSYQPKTRGYFGHSRCRVASYEKWAGLRGGAKSCSRPPREGGKGGLRMYVLDYDPSPAVPRYLRCPSEKRRNEEVRCLKKEAKIIKILNLRRLWHPHNV